MEQIHHIITDASGRYILATRGATLARVWIDRTTGALVLALWDYDTDKDATHPEARRVIKEDARIDTWTTGQQDHSRPRASSVFDMLGEYFPHLTMRELIARQ